jgi:hypothetical protein
MPTILDNLKAALANNDITYDPEIAEFIKPHSIEVYNIYCEQAKRKKDKILYFSCIQTIIKYANIYVKHQQTGKCSIADKSPKPMGTK